MGQCEKHGRYDHYYCVTCAREQRRQPIPAEESSTDHETTALNHALKLALGYQAEINDLKSQLAKSKEAEFAIGSQVEELKAQLEKKDDYYANELERLGLGSKFDLTQKLAAVETAYAKLQDRYVSKGESAGELIEKLQSDVKLAVIGRDNARSILNAKFVECNLLKKDKAKLIGALEVAEKFLDDNWPSLPMGILTGRDEVKAAIAEVRGKEESK